MRRPCLRLLLITAINFAAAAAPTIQTAKKSAARYVKKVTIVDEVEDD